LKLCHTEDYIKFIEKTSRLSKQELIELGKPNEIYYNKNTFAASTFAVGCLLAVVDDVCLASRRNGVAIIRPPGHHAHSCNAEGFCYFNNVAIAARYAIEIHSKKRILILDWDVHHGNGTQEIFKNDRS
jgi:histone deacetylase 6